MSNSRPKDYTTIYVNVGTIRYAGVTTVASQQTRPVTVSAAGGYPCTPHMTIPSGSILIGTRGAPPASRTSPPKRRAEAAGALQTGAARVAVIGRPVS